MYSYTEYKVIWVYILSVFTFICWCSVPLTPHSDLTNWLPFEVWAGLLVPRCNASANCLLHVSAVYTECSRENRRQKLVTNSLRLTERKADECEQNRYVYWDMTCCYHHSFCKEECEFDPDEVWSFGPDSVICLRTDLVSETVLCLWLQ